MGNDGGSVSNIGGVGRKNAAIWTAGRRWRADNKTKAGQSVYCITPPHFALQCACVGVSVFFVSKADTEVVIRERRGGSAQPSFNAGRLCESEGGGM